MVEEQKRDITIDCLRGVAVILMIAGHIGFGKEINYYIHSFHMPLFYFVSGLVFKVNKYKNLSGLVNRLLHRLIFPYFIVGFLHIIIQCVLDLLSSGNCENILIYILQVCWVNNNGFPIAGALWFLTSLFWTEIYVYILYNIVELFSEKYAELILSTVTIILFCVFYPFYKFAKMIPLSIMTLFAGSVFFSFGMAYKHFAFIIWKIKHKLFVIVAAIIVSFALSHFNGEVNLRELVYGKSILLFVVNALMIILSIYLSICMMSECNKQCSNNLITFMLNKVALMGRHSILYVFINALVIRFVQCIIGHIYYPSSSLIIIAVNFFVFLISTVIMYIITEKIYRTKISKFVS